jgi:hypothetical protein
MYLQIGYSNGAIASGLLAGEGGQTRAQGLARVPAARVPRAAYVDAVFVEVAPAVSVRPEGYLTRAQAGIRLYSAIFNYKESPAPRLLISV